MKTTITKNKVGRKPKPEAEKRSTRLTFRITPDQVQTVNRLAAENEARPSDVLRLLIDRAAGQVGHQLSV